MKTLFAGFVALTLTATGSGALEPTAGPVVLTVGGAIDAANRGAAHPDDATMLGFHDIGFELAAEFDRAALEALPQGEYESAVPGSEAMASFIGPKLVAALAAAGAVGETITLQGLDGYAVEVTRDYLARHDPILALSMDGRPLGVGGVGPAVVVFPPTTDQALAQAFADQKVWALFYIGVE